MTHLDIDSGPSHTSDSSARDAGLSLPELIITISVTSVLLTAIAAALIGMLNISTQATTQLSEAKDVGFVQTRVPVDLGSALAVSDALSTADIAADLGSQLGALGLGLPSLSGIDGLPGSNVLTIIRPNVASPGNFLVITYRYEQSGIDWVMNRYEFRPGTANPGPTINLVATELAAPPISTDPAVLPWQPGDPVDFAADVSVKAIGNRPAGRNLDLTFKSGRTFTTGGAGLSAVRSLPPADTLGLGDPLAPPSRCGKRISLVVDTSGSVPQGSGGGHTETAVVNFIEGFVGTPSQISLNGFDRTGYGMSFDIAADGSIDLSNSVRVGERAPFYSVLNKTVEVEAMQARVEALDDTDGLWSSGASLLPLDDPSYPDYDPDGNGIHWDQVGGGTNWQGGLWNLYKDTQGQVYASNQPDLVVFITDGQPNFIRTGPTTTSFVDAEIAKTEAATTADDLREKTQATMYGIMVGNKTGNTTYVNYLKDVVGNSVVWDGSNTAAAGVFLGEFDQLGSILRSIVISECGGTITLQKRIDTAGTITTPDSGLWKYTSNTNGDIGTRTLDRATASSVTFDYTFGASGGTKTVTLSEEPVDGYVFDRAECGADVIPAVTNASGIPEVVVDVDADAAESCLMISVPA